MSVGLVLVLVIMGVAMLNNFNKIRKAQNQIEEVAGTINTVKDSDNSGSSNEGNDPNGGQADGSEDGTADENTGAENENSTAGDDADQEKLTVQPIKIQIQKKATVHPIKKQKEMTVHRKTIQTEMLRPTAVRQRTVSQMK